MQLMPHLYKMEDKSLQNTDREVGLLCPKPNVLLGESLQFGFERPEVVEGSDRLVNLRHDGRADTKSPAARTGIFTSKREHLVDVRMGLGHPAIY